MGLCAVPSREDLASVLVGALSMRPQGSLMVQVCLLHVMGTALPRIKPDPIKARSAMCDVCA